MQVWSCDDTLSLLVQQTFSCNFQGNLSRLWELKAQKKMMNSDYQQVSNRAPNPSIRAPNSSHQKNNLVREKSGPELDHSGPDFDRLGTRFVQLKEVRAPIFRARGLIFTGLYNEKSIFRIRVHDFREKRHILERRLCRSVGQPSKLIVNHPILV